MNTEQFIKWRKDMGWSQHEAADALEINRSTIQQYERGARFDDERLVIIPRTISLACDALKWDKRMDKIECTGTEQEVMVVKKIKA